MAAIYAFLGKKDKALQLILENKDKVLQGGFIRFTQIDPLFENLRNDEEFKQIIRQQKKIFADIEQNWIR